MGPTFVCIGAQRSGTTWLDAHLRRHPRIWMPPVKELHFLERQTLAPMILPRPTWDQRGLRLRFTTAKRVRYAASHLRQPRHIPWVLRYLLLPRVLRSYPWLFMPGKEQISGEVTPAYAWLGVHAIRQLHALLPDLKLIYLLRDPVDRIWSQIAMNVGKNPSLVTDINDDHALHTFVVDTFATYLKHSNYLMNLGHWELLYKSEQIYIGFFEQIVHDPETLLHSIFQFLDVDDVSGQLSEDLHKPRNTWKFRAMPPQTKQWLTQQLMPEYEGLHTRFANAYTGAWLERARNILAHGEPM